jgi:hypothetical protein
VCVCVCVCACVLTSAMLNASAKAAAVVGAAVLIADIWHVHSYVKHYYEYVESLTDETDKEQQVKPRVDFDADTSLITLPAALQASLSAITCSYAVLITFVMLMACDWHCPVVPLLVSTLKHFGRSQTGVAPGSDVYFDDEMFSSSLVSDAAFTQSLETLIADGGQHPNLPVISPVFSNCTEKVAKESCIFAAAGRAVLLQVRLEHAWDPTFVAFQLDCCKQDRGWWIFLF